VILQPRSASVSFAHDLAVGDTLAAVAHRREGMSAELAAIVAAERDAILDALYRHGALLFRGFDVEGASGFERVTRALTPEAFSYVGGGAPRSRISGEVYTSTELSADQVLPLHNEASYFKELPAFVWFYCAVPPKQAGETPLGDMRRVLERLDPRLVERFDRSGLCYVSNLHGGSGFGRSWQATYQSDDRAEVEARLREKELEFNWTPEGNLRVLMRAPAVRIHSVTGRPYWGNQATTWHEANLPESAATAVRRLYGGQWNHPKSVFFGDGSPIGADDIHQIARILSEEETTFAWQAGDVVLVDNQAIAHGRRPFSGSRQIMVALA
jgi:alpha-ketoglutarate-dependent taurine dioxygenase